VHFNYTLLQREQNEPYFENQRKTTLYWSESGDDYGPILFNEEPDDDALEAYLRLNFSQEWPLDRFNPDDEDEGGPGFRGSCLHIERRGWMYSGG
jgi:hypothetical protein